MKKTILLLFLSMNLCTISGQINEGISITVLDSCNMERSCDFLQIDSSANNLWQVGVPSKVVFDSSFSPSRAIITDSTKTYPGNNHSVFDIKIYTNWSQSTLFEFRHKYNTDSSLDGGYLEFSGDNKVSWFQIDSATEVGGLQFLYENLYSENDTLLGGNPGFSGNSNGWVHTRIQWIWALAVKEIPDTLYVRFHFISDSINTFKDGWMVDDITISDVFLGTSIEEFDNRSINIEVSPNPSQGNTILSFKNFDSHPLTLSVSNSLGQIIHQVKNVQAHQIQLNTIGWSPGMYFVRLNNGAQLMGLAKLVVE